MFYILDKARNIRKTDNPLRWAKWLEKADRVVKHETIKKKRKVYTISTVFLGIARQAQKGPPLLFETMVFDKEGETLPIQERYSTWQEAEKGHERIRERILNTKKGEQDYV